MVWCFKLLLNITNFWCFHYIPDNCGDTEIQKIFSAFAVILEAIASATAKILKI